MEYEARAKAYSRAKMAASRAFQADINEKIRIKKARREALLPRAGARRGEGGGFVSVSSETEAPDAHAADRWVLRGETAVGRGGGERRPR